MNELIEYIKNHTERGECQCGKCFDKGPDRQAPKHSADVCFFWVSANNNPEAAELSRLLIANYPDLERLSMGPSYIEIGGIIGSQDLALRLMGLGELVGLWKVVTPKLFGASGAEALELAGSGFVMISGFRAVGAAA